MACLFPEIPEPTEPQERDRQRNAQAQRDYKANPENAHKIAAREALAKAVASGDMVRPDHCTECAIACQPEAHHADYEKPLEVEWLCKSCHERRHSEAADPRQLEMFGSEGLDTKKTSSAPEKGGSDGR